MHGFGRYYGVGHEPVGSVKEWDICSVVVWLIASEKSSILFNCSKWRDGNNGVNVGGWT